MDIIGSIESTIFEACPETSLNGLQQPVDDQLSLVQDGRLHASLRTLIAWGDVRTTLATATLFRLMEPRPGFLLPGSELRPTLALVRALADATVTGERMVTDFRSAAADLPTFRRLVRERAGERLAEAALESLRAAVSAAEIETAANFVIDRALTVLWALHGPVAHRRTMRPTLGWIAVDPELDTPTRPVNIGESNLPTADVVVSVEHDGRTIATRIRYAVFGSTDASVADPVPVLESLPVSDRPPVLPDDALVFVFLHGHSSRLEEGGGFAALLQADLQRYPGSRPVAVISFDYPTHGYSEYIDHEVLSPYSTTTQFAPDRPGDRRFGMLEYLEKVTIRVVEAIDQSMVRAGQLGIRDRIGAIVGGSMGGNLTLRLSERLVTEPSWLTGLVSWSPASIYPSLGRSDYIPSPGEHFDILGREALDRTTERAMQGETGDSRADFLRLQLVGERLLQDATPTLNGWVHLLVSLLGPPEIVAQGITHTLIHAEIGKIIVLRQSDTWLRADCRASYNLRIADQSARLSLQETYNAARRRMHYRVANEQLLFSHEDEVAASRGRPCFAISSVPTLLIAGSEDITDSRFDIYNSTRRLAPRMRANAGTAKFLQNTGHSILSERPLWLIREVIRFFSAKMNWSNMPRIVTAVRRDGRGRITELCAELSHWSPVPVETVIEDITLGRFPYFVELPGSDALPTRIIVVEVDGRFQLRTEATSSTEDNLDRLLLWNVHHLELNIVIGGDNLGGGDDNLNVRVHLRNGGMVSRENVNLSGEWSNNSVHSIQIDLPDDIEPTDLLRLEMEITSRGSVDFDNWSMAAVSVRGIGHGFDKEVGYWGFRRFTGDDRHFSLALNPTSTPPGQVDRLELSFRTGADNLRGTNDNLTLEIHYLGGHVQRVPNLNGCGEWASHSLSVVDLLLDHPVLPEQILRIVLETNFHGGFDGENWDMASLSIRATGHSIDVSLPGHNYFRFTGNNQKLTLSINVPLTAPGQVNMLQFTFRTGDDDLRGGLRDNINLAITFAEGHSQEIRNLNAGVTWNKHTTHIVNVALDAAVFPQAITRLQLDTLFSGGTWGDNWNMEWLTVSAVGTGVDQMLVTSGFKRFTGNDKTLILPVVIARPGEANVLELTFRTGGDNLRGGNDNITLTIRLRDGHTQRVANINGGAKWDQGSTHAVRIPLDRAVLPRDFAGIDMALSFGGGIGGDNWNMDELTVRAIGPNVDEQIATHGFKRFRGDDKVLSIPIVVAEPGQITALEFMFVTGEDNLRGDRDHVSAIIHYRVDGIEQEFFLRNLSGGAHWSAHTMHTVRKNLSRALAPADIVRFELETGFTGSFDSDNWDMDAFSVFAIGNEVAQDLVAAGYKRFSRDDGRHSVQVAAPGLVSSLYCVFRTDYDNLRGGNDNVNATIHYRDGRSEQIPNVNHGGSWNRYSVRHAVLTLTLPVVVDELLGMDLETTSGGGIGGDNWDMASVEVTAYGNNVRQPVFTHGFKRFTGDDRRLSLNRV